MLHSLLHHNHKFYFPNLPVSLKTPHFSTPTLLQKSIINSHTVSAINPSQEALSPWLSKIITTATVDLSTYFGDINESSSFQVTFSVVLSTAIAVFFFPTIQRRIKKAKQLVCDHFYTLFFPPSSCKIRIKQQFNF
jgi:hypothetical protein